MEPERRRAGWWVGDGGGLCRGVPSSGRPLHRAGSDTLDLFAHDERAAPGSSCGLVSACVALSP